MRIATWNVNGLRARQDYLLRWLAEAQPDIVGLQELKMQDGLFPSATFEAAGYRAVTHGEKARRGVAVLSREPARVSQVGLPGQEDLGARLLTAELGGLSFTTVYVPNGKAVGDSAYQRKLDWLDALAAHFKERHDPAVATVLCGDFNIVPGALDSCDEERLAGKIGLTESERERFANLLQWGFRDLFRESHPGCMAFSWWSYGYELFRLNRGLRIDFLLGTSAVAERLESVRIDRAFREKVDGLRPSDHAPVIAELN